jgi:mediator of RNA polymerase II transcription subunit 5
MLSPNLPRPVLTLCGPSVVRLLSEWRGGTQSFDVPALRQEVIKATGMPISGSVFSFTLSIPSQKTSHLPEPKEPILNSPSPGSADQSRRALQDALVLLQSGKPPFLNVAACLAETPAIEFLQTFWLALDMPIKTDATADAAKRLAVFILATPRAPPTPPLLPIFLHNLLPSLIDKFDNPNLGQAMTGDLDLLIAIISSSLMAALQLERALYAASGGEQVFAFGSSSSAMASRLALGLRHRKSSSKGKLIAQRLTSSQTFVANFPVFKTEI